MAAAETIERLRYFLRDLSPRVRSRLAAEFERSVLGGAEPAGAEVILDQLRSILREQREGAARVNQAARFFFRPLEPFLVDDVADHRHPGRIARCSLDALWIWVRRDLVPDAATVFSARIGDPLIAADERQATELAHALQDRVVDAIEAAFAAVAEDGDLHDRLLMQIGTPRAQDDATTLLHVLKGRDRLAALAAQLPLQIADLDAHALDRCAVLVEDVMAQDEHLFIYALLAVMRRLSAPWQLIRLGTRAAGSNVAARVAETNYAVAVTVVLTEMERLIDELHHELRNGCAAGVGALLKRLDDCARGLRTELALPVGSTWGRALSTQRFRIGNVLRGEVEKVSARVRRLLGTRHDGEARLLLRLDDAEVEEVAALVEFTCNCRLYAGEFAAGEVAVRALTELRQYLDATVRALLAAIPRSDPVEARFRRSQLDAARRFCGLVFGEDYAEQLARTAERACLAEPVAAVA